MEKINQWLKRYFLFVLTGLFLVIASSAHAISLISDEETENFLHATLRPIFKASGTSFNPRHIYIVNDKSLNAFVIDGNSMFVTVGTLIAADSQNEISGVLAHETGHIQGGHILRHKIQAQEVQRVALASMLLGGAAGLAAGRADVSIAAILGSQGTAINSMLSYQISEERSADEAAVKLLKKINQSPVGMLNFMKKIQKQNLVQGIEETSYFRTHPITAERISFLEKATKESNGAKFGPQEKEFSRIKAKIFAYIEKPEQTFIKYPPSDTSIEAQYARTIAYFKDNRIETALNNIEKLVQAEPNNPYFYELKGQMLLETGKIKPAVSNYRKALDISPHSSLFKLNLVQAMLEDSPNAREQQQIVDMLNQVLIYNPQSEAWILLSRAYGLQQNASGYNYAAAEYSFLIKDFTLAKKQAEQALKSNPSPALKLKLDDLLSRIKEQEKEDIRNNPYH
ncbi:MAG: M48 family metalloprotease [Alphaproteobacteria bacterium]|nr:M48 family metalloprotease [Alphaproteobacteria bacterium]